jgi:hypothetical protein
LAIIEEANFCDNLVTILPGIWQILAYIGALGEWLQLVENVGGCRQVSIGAKLPDRAMNQKVARSSRAGRINGINHLRPPRWRP